MTRLLDLAEKTLREGIKDLNLRARIIRKERAIGTLPGGPEGKLAAPNGSGGKSIRRELLDELVLRVHHALRSPSGELPKVNLPFCAFNGGSDVWVDCGNKQV